jgi:hypothetical protein
MGARVRMAFAGAEDQFSTCSVAVGLVERREGGLVFHFSEASREALIKSVHGEL